jgi:hypothetical protein
MLDCSRRDQRFFRREVITLEEKLCPSCSRCSNRILVLKYVWASQFLRYEVRPSLSAAPTDGSRTIRDDWCSYAMANCFEIEKQIKKRRLRKSWYVGERIVKKTGEASSCGAFEINLLPDSQPQRVFLFR